MKIGLVLGTRPQIIKSVPILVEASQTKSIQLDVIHTGQHYDYEMSRIFFDEMDLSEPLINLNVGSGAHGLQTGKMMIEIENVLNQIKPDIVLVPGDTNSTLAGALTAAKMHIQVAHFEAGARSYDMSMPEEINRRLTDHCSDILFTVTENCKKNLLKEDIPSNKIFQVGDTMYDVLLMNRIKINKSKVLKKNDLVEKEYITITTHRQENVDDIYKLKCLVNLLTELSDLKFVFPIHPRTRDRLEDSNLIKKLEKAENVKILSPISYCDMIKLIKNSKILLTDSGGMQKEAYWLKTPCITLRKNTEWIETIELGANILLGVSNTKIKNHIKMLFNEDIINADFTQNPYGDGKSAEKIINILENKIK